MESSDPKLGLTINIISGVVAVLFALVLPVAYFLFLYGQETAALEARVVTYSNEISHVLDVHKVKTDQVVVLQGDLRDVLEHGQVASPLEWRRILDVDNNELASAGPALAAPVITRSEPLNVGSTTFGRIEVSRSIRPLVINTSLVMVLGLLLGVPAFMFIRTFPLRALSVAKQEIETRREAESNLQKSLALLGATLESTADGILVIDSYGRIVNFNKRFISMWHIPEEIVANKEHNQIVSRIANQLRDASGFMGGMKERGRDIGIVSDEHEILELLDGRSIELNSRPQMVNGAVVGRVLSFHDITERKRAEGMLSGEKQVLEMIVARAPFAEALSTVARNIEKQSGSMFCAILIPDEHGVMQHVASGGLPKDFIMEANAIASEIHAREQQAGAEDKEKPGISRMELERNPLAPYRDLAENYGLYPGRTAPVFSSNGNLLGMAASYYHLGDVSAQQDEGLLEIASNQIRIVIERKNAETRLEYLAHFDPLTKLPNRRLFRDRLAHALLQSERENRPVALLFLDLDRFKTINDTLGHDAGDQLLKAVAKRLQGCVREEDTVARLGGDEFTIILEQIDAPEDAGVVARKILDTMKPPFRISGNEIFVTTSIGITVYPLDQSDIGGLLKNADTALYGAKEAGRNTFKFYSAEMNDKAFGRLEMENKLRNALDNNEFIVYYQPKVSLKTGEPTGAEALLRWNSPGRGIVSPVEFIPLLEETGMIKEVGRWVLRTVCAQNKKWLDMGLPPLRIAVNISARQFLHHDLITDVSDALRETGLSPDQLELELTESILMQDPKRARELLETIKALGVVRIDIDDFGTGYSSLSYLKRFPINVVKIDASFIRDIPEDKEDDAIVLAIIAMAHSLGIKVVAEGVEDEKQREFLKAHDCDEMQGYIMSHPLPVNDFESWVREHAEPLKQSATAVS